MTPNADHPTRTTLAEARASFRARCRAKDLAAGTLDWYARHLVGLARFLEARGVREVGAVLPGHLRDYLAHRREGDWASGTAFRAWGAMKCFFGFLFRDGLLAANPMTLVERPRRERRIIEPLTMAQVRDLLAQPDTATAKGLRDRAMMFLMLDSGLRLSEVLRLEARRVYLAEARVTVFGKGRKERSVPIGSATRAAMEAYSAAYPAAAGYFFVGRGGRPLQSRAVQTAMRRYGQRAGIAGVRVSPHTLRHTSALQFIRNGGDPFSLQSILGHSTLDMVRIYVNLARGDVAEQHRKFSPMDRLLGVTPTPAAV